MISKQTTEVFYQQAQQAKSAYAGQGAMNATPECERDSLQSLLARLRYILENAQRQGGRARDLADVLIGPAPENPNGPGELCASSLLDQLHWVARALDAGICDIGIQINRLEEARG